MIKRLSLLSLLLVLFSTPAFAQGGTFVPTMLRLRDDSNAQRIFLLKENGEYLLTFNIDALRVESYGRLVKKGCNVAFEEITDHYRVVMNGDTCNQTGKVVLQLFGVGTFTILDRHVD